MGGNQGSPDERRLVIGTAVVTVPLLLVAPAGATTVGAGGRVLPPRGALHASAVSAASTNSPYDVKNTVCGESTLVLHRTSYVTLFAYGADGGSNGFGVAGGAGAVAVGSFSISPNQSIVPVAGCKGGSAAPNTESPTSGGWSLTRARGGNGGRGAVSGANAGAGGGYSGWYEAQAPLIEAGAGGGAGGLAGGGAGGDAGSAGANGATGAAVGGGAGAFDTFGAAGTPDGNPGRGYGGGTGSKLEGVGGGGGGSGFHAGGGGGGGDSATPTPGAGGGGGGSDVQTFAGYWAEVGGVGDGTGLDGLAQQVEVRAVVGNPTFPGRDIVRGVTGNGTHGGGYIVLGTGEIRRFSQGVNPANAKNGPSWPGQDVARGIATLPDRSGGYVVDLHGQLHPFSLGEHPAPPTVTNRVLWPGKDVARGVTILPDGSGGYVQGRDGRLYAFAIGSNPKPPDATNVPTWPGRDMARGVTSPFVDSHGVSGGWVADVTGRLRPWGQLLGGATPPAVGPRPAARGVASFAGGAGGVLVDGAGNLSSFASPGAP